MGPTVGFLTLFALRFTKSIKPKFVFILPLDKLQFHDPDQDMIPGRTEYSEIQMFFDI